MSAGSTALPGKAAGKSAATAKPPKTRATENLAGLRPYLRRYPGAIALGLTTLVLMGVIGNLIPLATGILTDTLTGSPRPFAHAVSEGGAATVGAGWLTRVIPFYAPHSRNTVMIYCLLLVLCVGIKGVLSFTTRWVLIGVSRDIEFDIRNDLLKRLLLLEPEFYVRNRTGELMSRATNDLNNVRMVLGPGIMYSGTTLATRAGGIRGGAALRKNYSRTVRENSGFAGNAFRQSAGKFGGRARGARLRAGRGGD